MYSFLKKLSLFLFPIGIFFAFPVVVFVLGREYYSLDFCDAVAFQEEYSETVIGFAYNGDLPGFKKALIAQKNPITFALGTSRTGQFRKEFFTSSAAFATAGNAVVSIRGMKTFIEELPEGNATKLILLGMDQNMFLPFHGKEVFSQGNLLLSSSRAVYQDYFSGKLPIKELWFRSQNTKNVGILALLKHNGFREDGSYQYEKELTASDREKVLKAKVDGSVSMLRNNRGSSFYSAPVSDSVLSDLRDLLDFCRKKGIYVIGFFPPYPPAVYQELTNKSDTYTERLLQLPETVGKVFSDSKLAFYDFSDISIFGGKDTEFVDETHGTDKLYLRMTIYMTERNKRLAGYVDIEKDRQLLKNTKGDFIENNI